MRRARIAAGVAALFLVGLMIGCDDVGEGDGGVGEGEGEGEATFSSLYSGYFDNCAGCHAPDAPGRTAGIETELDFTTRATAHATLTGGNASGLTGNQEGCNGVPLLGASYGSSLVVATMDEEVRRGFDLSSHPGCDQDAISDMTVKVGEAPSAAFLSALRQWIEDGKPNN